MTHCKVPSSVTKTIIFNCVTVFYCGQGVSNRIIRIFNRALSIVLSIVLLFQDWSWVDFFERRFGKIHRLIDSLWLFSMVEFWNELPGNHVRGIAFSFHLQSSMTHIKRIRNDLIARLLTMLSNFHFGRWPGGCNSSLEMTIFIWYHNVISFFLLDWLGVGFLSYNFLRWLWFDVVEPDYLFGFFRLRFFIDSFFLDDMGVENTSLKLAVLV